jgi:hypothetical protein
MIEVEKSADQYALRDDCLEIEFQFVGDRWQHSIALRYGNGWLPVLISEEGQPADAALPSPAFQDLRVEQLAEEVFEFQLMGQSGKGVYSAAVRFDAAERTHDFDLCARGPIADSLLCTVSTYRLAGPERLTVTSNADSAVLTSGEGRLIRVAPVLIAGNPAGECRVTGDASERRLSVGCFGVRASNSNEKTASIRWRYRLGHP